MFCSREKKFISEKRMKIKCSAKNRCSRHFLGALYFCDASTCFLNPWSILSLERESRPRALFILDSSLEAPQKTCACAVFKEPLKNYQ